MNTGEEHPNMVVLSEDRPFIMSEFRLRISLMIYSKRIPFHSMFRF